MPEAAVIAAHWHSAGTRPALCRKLLARVQQAVGAILFLQLVIITAVVLAGVISRYVFNSSFPWTEELASWTLVSLTFVGMAAGHIADRHLSIDMLDRFAPAPWVRNIQRLAVDTVLAATTILLLAGGVSVLQRIGGVSAALQWDARIKYAVIPIAAVASLAFILLARLAAGASWIRALGPMLVAAMLCAAAAFYGSPFPDVSPSAIMAIAFFGGMMLGVPVGYAMLFAAFLGGWSGDLQPIAGIVDSVVQGTSAFVILAVPFFLTAGYLMNAGGMSERLIDFASALVGHFHGGLAQANVFHSVLLGGVCGSTSADAASTTKILVPEMIKRGYAPEFACAVTAVGSILPACFPPSIALLIYASVAGVSVAQMFIAGIVPGFLLCAVMMLTVHVIARRRHYEKAPRRASVATMARAGLRAAPAMFVAVVIVGLLRAGVMTATEVGTIAVLWAFVIGKFVYRGFTFRQCYHDLSECALDTGADHLPGRRCLAGRLGDGGRAASRPRRRLVDRHGPSEMGNAAAGQCWRADRRLPAGNRPQHPDPGAAADAAARRHGGRPDPSRHHHRAQPGARHGGAADRHPGVRLDLDRPHPHRAGVPRMFSVRRHLLRRAAADHLRAGDFPHAVEADRWLMGQPRPPVLVLSQLFPRPSTTGWRPRSSCTVPGRWPTARAGSRAMISRAASAASPPTVFSRCRRP